MKLTDRGVSDNDEPTAVETLDSAIAGKYRGAALKFHTSTTKVPVLQPKLDLLYRGVRYLLGESQPVTPAPTVAQAPAYDAPVELVYRGVRYTTGAAATPQAETTPANTEAIADLARDLLIQLRQRRAQREQSVLARFEAAIGASQDEWSHYHHHDAAMS